MRAREALTILNDNLDRLELTTHGIAGVNAMLGVTDLQTLIVALGNLSLVPPLEAAVKDILDAPALASSGNKIRISQEESEALKRQLLILAQHGAVVRETLKWQVSEPEEDTSLLFLKVPESVATLGGLADLMRMLTLSLERPVRVLLPTEPPPKMLSVDRGSVWFDVALGSFAVTHVVYTILTVSSWYLSCRAQIEEATQRLSRGTGISDRLRQVRAEQVEALNEELRGQFEQLRSAGPEDAEAISKRINVLVDSVKRFSQLCTDGLEFEYALIGKDMMAIMATNQTLPPPKPLPAALMQALKGGDPLFLAKKAGQDGKPDDDDDDPAPDSEPEDTKA